MLAAIERMAGPLPDVRTVPVQIGEPPDRTRDRLEAAARDLAADEFLFLVDIEGSTPFNLCCRQCRGESVVLTGMNMPMLFKLATADRSRGAGPLAAELMATGQKSIHIRTGQRTK
jgi:mannose/fructose-specific phosphotransferase system component IIA